MDWHCLRLGTVAGGFHDGRYTLFMRVKHTFTDVFEVRQWQNSCSWRKDEAKVVN